MKFEVFLKRKACVDAAQSARKKVAYVEARDIEQAKAVALKRAENQAFVLDGTPRRAA